MPKKSESNLLDELSAVERLRIASMDECERLSSLSEETLVRHYPQFVIDLSPRRKGMRVMHALMLREKKPA